MEFCVLLDAPAEPKQRIQIAKLGEDFEHGRYGRFAITPEDVSTWQKNLSALPGGRALIDADHMADRTPRNTEAAGWITGVTLEGQTPTAEVEWTPKGKQAIEEKRYLFISPTYGPFADETGVVHENTLIGASLTNRPFLNMPAITLASAERVSEAIDADPAARFYTRALDGELGEHTQALVTLDVSQADRDKAHAAGNSLPDKSYPINNKGQLKAAAILASSGHGNVAAAKKLIRRRAKELGVDVGTLPGFGSGKSLDSPRAMPVDVKLLEALGLNEDEDLITALDGVELDEDAQKKLLDAATALKDKAEKPAEPVKPEPTKTLEQQASEAGKIVLDTEQWQKTQREATAGATAMKQLHANRFETAFTLALENKAGPKVTPAEKDSLKHFFELDADATIAMIEGREPILSATPRGGAALELGADADPDEVAARGLDPASHQLDQAIKAKLSELGKPMSEYPVILDQYARGEIAL